MIGPPFDFSSASRQAARFDKLGQQLAVVDDFVVAAGLRVVVAQAVHAVGAVGDDPPHVVAARAFPRSVAASCWNSSSSPIRRADSPVQRSSGPSTAKFTFAALQQPHDAAGDFLHAAIVRRGAADPVQHVEIRVLAGQRHVEPGRPGQAVGGLSPQGLPARSVFCRATAGEPRSAPSPMRYRRMSVIIRIGLMPSGQTSAQAPQVVHDHSVSAAIGSPCTFVSTPPAIHARRPRSCTTFRGESGLPASNAGQLSSQRPQETQASSSISCR